jgi:hypothetical protein
MKRAMKSRKLNLKLETIKSLNGNERVGGGNAVVRQ